MDATDTHEQCEECGFDAAEWNDQDTINTLRHAPDLLHGWGANLNGEQMNMRPSDGVWSVAEYIDHVRETLFGMRFVVDLAVGDPGFDLGALVPGPAGPHRTLDPDVCLDAVRRESDALVVSLAALDGDVWTNHVVISGNERSAMWASRHGVHDLWHHLTDIASIAATVGAAADPQIGRVHQISQSAGGVPKTSVQTADVGRRGVVGDAQRARAHHGRPWQALCLWSSEVIADLAADGHPIFAGAAGENITIEGLDWASVHPGQVLVFGDVVCQISAPAVPCSKNNQWFSDGDSQRIAYDRNPELTRWYASVLTPGRVSAGDRVVVRPPV